VGKKKKKTPQMRLPIALPLVAGTPGKGGAIEAPGEGAAATGVPIFVPHLGQNWEPSGIGSAQ